MNDEHIRFGFVKTKTIEELKAEFLNIPAEFIQSVEQEHRLEYGKALLIEAKIDNFTGNVLKAILLAAFTILFAITVNWYFTPFTFDKIFFGLFFGFFIGLPTLIMCFICYMLSVLIISEIIKRGFFNKQTKFLEKLRKIKTDIDSEKRYQERRLEFEKQQLIKNKSDSIFRDTETIRSHFAHSDHTPLLSNTKLENSVSDIFNEITQWAIYEANRKDKTDSYKSKEIENYKKLLFLLAHVEQEEFVVKVNKLVKLMSLVNPNDTNLEFSKSLVVEIANLRSSEPKLLSHMADALLRYELFLKNFEAELTNTPKINVI